MSHTDIAPVEFYKCLADQTRLYILMLLDKNKELCVCELTYALELSQPKISRHIALLRACGLLSFRKEGKWVYYQISDSLPEWQKQVLRQTQLNSFSEWHFAVERLNNMTGRPDKPAICCN